MGSAISNKCSFIIKIAAAIAVISAGDLLFWQHWHGGFAVGAFASAWLTATLLARRSIWRDGRAWLAVAAAAVFAGALLYDPSLLGWVLFWSALSSAAILPSSGAFDDGWRWFQRLWIHALLSPARPVFDWAKLARIRRKRPTSSWRTMLPMLVLPVLGGIIFIALFAVANPLIEGLLERIDLPSPSFETVMHGLLWAMCFVLGWSSLRARAVAPILGTFDGTGDLKIAGFSVASVTLSLILFNLLFAVQNALDAMILWGGVALPKGMTMAEYAHRGAYPLIVTALLAGLFVLVALRPGSTTARTPLIRALVVAWIAQNLFLVASSIMRTLDYIAAYSLTELRIAALVWMVLVGVGLLLICWRMLGGYKASWLINTNLIAAGLVLTGYCFVDSGEIAARWNVRHAREVRGGGMALDLCYLGGLGPSSLLSLVELERRPLPPAFAARFRFVRQRVMTDMVEAAGQDQLSWRNQDRLHEALAALGPKWQAGYDSNARDCDGDVIPTTPEAAPEAANSLTQGAER